MMLFAFSTLSMIAGLIGFVGWVRDPNGLDSRFMLRMCVLCFIFGLVTLYAVIAIILQHASV